MTILVLRFLPDFTTGPYPDSQAAQHPDTHLSSTTLRVRLVPFHDKR
jgi:hypothetical protein